MSDPYKGDAGLVRVADPEGPASMRIRITVDHEACMSYVHLPVAKDGRPKMNERLPGPYAINLDRTPGGEAAGIEIDGIIEAADIEDITERSLT